MHMLPQGNFMRCPRKPWLLATLGASGAGVTLARADIAPPKPKRPTRKKAGKSSRIGTRFEAMDPSEPSGSAGSPAPIIGRKPS